MKILSSLLSVIICFLFLSAPTLNSQELKADKDVVIGKLENGMKYYIRKNIKPEKRAELRLVVNAGSILENDDQKGLAHFVEHMAFNGTAHFSKNELVDYLELVGVRFGPELNASTGFDETVYMLQVPTDKPEILEKGFLVLEDWAHGQSFDTTEIDKERGVIGEEWRLGRGASMRMLDKQLPVILKNSRYAERLPIGDKSVIDNFKYHSLTSFYRDWYRPDLMCVIAVGDFDVKVVEQSIREHFAGIKMRNEAPERKIFPIPYHKETLYTIASDKEAEYTTVGICYKSDRATIKTEQDLRRELPFDLLRSAINKRLIEMLLVPDPPFSYAMFVDYGFARSIRTDMLMAYTKEDGIERALETLQREAERVRLFGISATELEREKADVLRQLEKRIAEKDKTESNRLVDQYRYSFLENTNPVSLEDRYNLLKKYLPSITVAEINSAAKEVFIHENRVVVVNIPEKTGVTIPTEKSLSQRIEKALAEKITPYVDQVADKPFIAKEPVPGTIVSSAFNKELGLSDWKLSNGVRVIIKQTDFKNDEIRFNAFAPGGSSLENQQDNVSAKEAVQLVIESGLGDYHLPQLQKFLSGKIAGVESYIDFYEQGMRGAASPSDAETMFQLAYNLFTSPRMDSSAFLAHCARMTAWLQNSANSPETAFNDTLTVTVTNYHPLLKPYNINTPKEIDMNKALAIYKNRFADASGFTFVFTGNFDTVKLKPMLLKYIGGLPALNRHEKWVDLKFTNPAVKVEKTVVKGIEPKSSVAIVFSSDFDFSAQKEFISESMVQALDIRLREVVREDKSGTYGVGVWQSIYRIPTAHHSINIQFGCDPKRVDELTATVFAVIDSIKQFGFSELTLAKVKETSRRNREVNLKNNKFWLAKLTDCFSNNDDPMDIMRYGEWIDSLSREDIHSAAKKYLTDQYVKVVLMPQQ